MRMADQRGHARRAVLGLFEQRFQTPGRAGDVVRLDAARHA